MALVPLTTLWWDLGPPLLSPLLFPAVVPTTVSKLRQMGTSKVDCPLGAAHWSPQREVSAQTGQTDRDQQSPESLLLQHLWGSLYVITFLPKNRNGVTGEEECTFPASGQLQLTRLQRPKALPLNAYFYREKVLPGS